MSPQDVAGWFKWISLEKALQYSKEGLHFYIKPKTFFESIFKKTAQEIVVQLFFYLLVMLAVVMTITNHDLKTMGRRIFISLIIQLAVGLIPALIGAYLTDKIFSINKKPETYFFSLSIFYISIFIFTSPIMAAPLSLYLETQKYEFLLVALISSSFIFYLTNIFYSKVIFNRVRHIITSSILTFISWNLLVTIVAHMPAIDTYDSNKLTEKIEIDPVYAEYDKLSNRINLYDIFKIPSSKIELSYGDTILYCFAFGEKVPYISQTPYIIDSNSEKTDSLITGYKKSNEILKFAIDSLKFERNKLFYNNLSKYYKSVIEYGSKPQDTSTYARKGNMRLGNRDAIISIYATPISAPHVQQFLLLSDNIRAREEAKNIARAVTGYSNALYFSPALLLDKLFWEGSMLSDFSSQ